MPKPVKTPVQQVLKVQGDASGSIRNGFPAIPYLPRDPWRRTALLTALGLAEGQLLTRKD